MSGTPVRLEGVSAGWGGDVTVADVHLHLAPGSVTALVGTNGSGKSTLLKTLYRVLRPLAGRVVLDGGDAWTLPARQVARTVGVLGQDERSAFDFSVRETVAHGRSPRLGTFGRLGAEDRAVVELAMERTGCAHLADRVVSTLSGGERQRTLLARALAQQPSVLVLDEPTNHLDPRHQMEVMALVRSLGLTTVAALHSLDLAVLYADQVAVVHDGAVSVVGPPRRVLTPALLREVFGVDGSFVDDPVTAAPRLLLRPWDGAPAGGAAPS